MADVVLPILLTFPPEKKKLNAKEYDVQIKAFLKELGNVPTSAWTKQANDQNLLEVLDPAVNSIPYLFTLTKQIEAATAATPTSTGKDPNRLDTLLPLAVIFLTSCDPVQMRYVGEHWRLVFEWVMRTLSASGTTDVRPLVLALLRLDPSAGTFTSNHLAIVRLCLRLGIPSQALPILDKNISAYPQIAAKSAPDELFSDEHELSSAFINPRSGISQPIHSEHVLQFYLLGAYVYIGLRQYPRARLFLEYVILSPATQHSVSALQVEAYKKWVLLGLLAEGSRYPVPRTTDQAVMKSIRSIAKSYDTLADDFEKREWQKFRADADVGTQIWADDGNMRLVTEVADALMRSRVIDLQKTYAALSIRRVADHLGLAPDQTSLLLTDMIRDGHLHASVLATGSEPVLQFHPDLGQTAHAAELDAQTKRIADLVTSVRDADRRLQLTKEYVDHQKRAKRSNGPDGDLADAMDLTWDPPITQPMDDDGDEDIMAG